MTSIFPQSLQSPSSLISFHFDLSSLIFAQSMLQSMPICADKCGKMSRQVQAICAYKDRRSTKSTVADWRAATAPIDLVLGHHLLCLPGELMWSSMLLLTCPHLIYLPSLNASCWHLPCALYAPFSDFTYLFHTHCNSWHPEPWWIKLSY